MTQVNRAAAAPPRVARMTTHKIFVPVDGSGCAQRAVQHAMGLARLMGDCTIHVAHAHDEAPIYGEIAVYVTPGRMDELQRKHSDALIGRVEPLLAASGLPWQKEVLVGPIAQTLVERAVALGCDAIVMGTHGHSSLGNALLGSIAGKVAHLSPLPVTLVK